MADQEKQTEKETRRKEKLALDASMMVTRDRERRKSYLAKEEVMAKVSDSRHTQRADRRAIEDVEQKARELARKQAYDAREKSATDAREAKKLKDRERPNR